MKISTVIPTRGRPHHLRKLLISLQNQILQPSEIIIVDASENESFHTSEFENLPISFIRSTPSVCLQRNVGIRRAENDWIFLCDDDIELPQDYLLRITDHIKSFPATGAVSGLVMQKHNNEWVGQYPVVSKLDLAFRFIFGLSIWGEIKIHSQNPIINCIKNYLERKGNHLSKSGWPIITNFSNPYFKTPVYGMGASVIKKEWLLQSPYDESLDSHGLGDHYGVALGFPDEGIHVINKLKAYHNTASENRLEAAEQYYRRVLALIHFSRQRHTSGKIRRGWLLWSLTGRTIYFIFSKKNSHAMAGIKLIIKLLINSPVLLKQ